MDVTKLFKTAPLPKSKLSVNELIEISQKQFFKVGIKERASTLGGFKYVGFQYTFHRDKKKQLVVYVNLYFYHQGSNVDLTKNAKGKTIKSKRKPRETYLLVAKFPYSMKQKNMKRLYDVPLQIFSSDPSFKFYFAYALNKMDAVVTDEKMIVKWLGKSLTDAPKITNPDLMTQLTKHFYKFFKFIANVRPKAYMDKKYLIPSSVKIVNQKIGG